MMQNGFSCRVRKGRAAKDGRWVAVLDFSRDEQGHHKIRQHSFPLEREAKAWLREQRGHAILVFIDVCS